MSSTGNNEIRNRKELESIKEDEEEETKEVPTVNENLKEEKPLTQKQIEEYEAKIEALQNEIRFLEGKKPLSARASHKEFHEVKRYNYVLGIVLLAAFTIACIVAVVTQDVKN
ncbi:hypothetical protein WA158_000439 [Blastocystis sp. Blastoise]